MRYDGRALLAVLNMYVRIKSLVATFDANHSGTDSSQTISRCLNAEASLFCSPLSQPLAESMCHAKRSV